MIKKLLFTGLVILIITNVNNLSAETSVLIPLKKPSLTNEEILKRLTKNIIKTIKKPKKIKEIKIIEKKKDIKDKKLSFKIPKKKPTIPGITTSRSNKISKYYSKKDFNIARKAISEMQKNRWNSSLKIAKKAKDKSIYNFIKWSFLLTTGNQASFYDYQIFIDRNNQYRRVDSL
jgi:soluble lytic murein transglycosylase